MFEAYCFYARHTFAGGRPEKAIALYEQAGMVRPEDFQSRLLMAQIYDDLGRREEAAATRRRGVAMAEQHLKWNPDDARATYGTNTTATSTRSGITRGFRNCWRG